MKDQATKDKFVELRAAGLSYDRISSQLNTSKQTLIKWAQDLNLEIHNLKALEMDALYHKHFVATQSRIEIFGEIIQKLRDEIKKRNFENIPTDKLIDLFLKTFDAANGERNQLTLLREKTWTEDMPGQTIDEQVLT